MTIDHAPPDLSTLSKNEPLALEPVTPAAGSRRRAVPRWLRRTVGPLLLLAGWQVLSATGVLHRDILASPAPSPRPPAS